MYIIKVLGEDNTADAHCEVVQYSAIEEHDTVRGRDWHATVRARITVTTMTEKTLCERGTRNNKALSPTTPKRCDPKGDEIKALRECVQKQHQHQILIDCGFA